MIRKDTHLTCIETDTYKLLVWAEYDVTTLLEEAAFCFRILSFLGAPAGFTVHWWRIMKDRVLKPAVFPTRAEVNGGWAYRGRPAVWIYRLEEWDRVLIHECIHALDWDVHPSANVKTCLEASQSGQLMDALGEAATEFFAEWFWCIIHSPSSDKSGLTWTKQKAWQLNQAYTIIARNGGRGWSEDTNVFAYYVLKAALAQDDTEFLLSWHAGVEDADRWCGVWEKYKSVFYHKAAMLKDKNSKTVSMRMTNPELE